MGIFTANLSAISVVFFCDPVFSVSEDKSAQSFLRKCVSFGIDPCLFSILIKLVKVCSWDSVAKILT